MANSKSNKDALVERINQQTERVKLTLRELVQYIKENPDKVPIRMIQELQKRSLALADSIKEYTLPETGQTVFQKADEIINSNPINLNEPQKDNEEFALYQEFGFTRDEFNKLLLLRKEIGDSPEQVDFENAFNHFVEILRENKIEEKENWRDIVPAASGLIGIGTDIVIFSTSGNIIALVGSCSTGVLSIATAFKSVKKKILKTIKKWFRRK